MGEVQGCDARFGVLAPSATGSAKLTPRMAPRRGRATLGPVVAPEPRYAGVRSARAKKGQGPKGQGTDLAKRKPRLL
jgi:hypothetical protein